MASKTQEKQENRERAIDAAKAYVERIGMCVLEPLRDGFHANDAGTDVYVTVAARTRGNAPHMTEPTTAQRRRAAAAGWRLDHISLHIIAPDRALLRHMRACGTE